MLITLNWLWKTTIFLLIVKKYLPAGRSSLDLCPINKIQKLHFFILKLLKCFEKRFLSLIKYQAFTKTFVSSFLKSVEFIMSCIAG